MPSVTLLKFKYIYLPLEQNEQYDYMKLTLQIFDYDDENFENTNGATRNRKSK